MAGQDEPRQTSPKLLNQTYFVEHPVVLVYDRKYTQILVYGSSLFKTPCQYMFGTRTRRKQRAAVDS